MTRARITLRERERHLAERATIPARALAYRTVGPRYLERAVAARQQLVQRSSRHPLTRTSSASILLPTRPPGGTP